MALYNNNGMYPNASNYHKLYGQKIIKNTYQEITKLYFVKVIYLKIIFTLQNLLSRLFWIQWEFLIYELAAITFFTGDWSIVRWIIGLSITICIRYWNMNILTRTHGTVRFLFPKPRYCSLQSSMIGNRVTSLNNASW